MVVSALQIPNRAEGVSAARVVAPELSAGPAAVSGVDRLTMNSRMHRSIFPLALALTACAPHQRPRAPTALADCAPAAHAKRAFSAAFIPSLAGNFTVVQRDTANTWIAPVTDTMTLRAVDSLLVPLLAQWERHDGRSRAIDSLPRLVSAAERLDTSDNLHYFDWRLYVPGILVRGVVQRFHATPTTFTIEWISATGFGGRWTRRWGNAVESAPDGSTPRPYAGVLCAIRKLDAPKRSE